jgi:hypothetical protein
VSEGVAAKGLPVNGNHDSALRVYAQNLWASDEYQAWKARVREAVADGTIYDEPPLNGVNAGSS